MTWSDDYADLLRVKVVNLHEAKTHLSRLIQQALDARRSWSRAVTTPWSASFLSNLLALSEASAGPRARWRWRLISTHPSTSSPAIG